VAWPTSPQVALKKQTPLSPSCSGADLAQPQRVHAVAPPQKRRSGVAEQLYQVELTANFLERLDAIEAFLTEAGAVLAFDDLLAELRATVIPNLHRFPRVGRRYLDHPPQSAEALAQLATWPAGTLNALREYLHGDHLLLYAAMEPNEAVYLLSIRHHRELTFDFAAHWPV